MKNNKNTAIIFDLDGTLIDSKPKLILDVKRVFDNLGYSVSHKEIENSKNWYDLAKSYGITQKDFDREFDKRKSWEQSLKDGEAPLFNDTIPCLEKLCSEGFLLGVLTKSIPEYTEQKLDFYNLNKYFGNNISVTPVTSKTKEKEAIKLIEKINLNTIELIFFIGDRAEDVMVDKPIQNKYNLNAKGIWLNRKQKPTPTELISYKQINSLYQLFETWKIK